MVGVRVPVVSSQYWICADDVEEDDTNAATVASGLVQLLPGQVIVTAVADLRMVRAEVLVCSQEPAPLPDEWQDAAEVSIETHDGVIRVCPLESRPVGPNLAGAGPGWYRLRLAAAGRDPANDERPNERHLIEVWPAAPSEPARLRLTSQFAAAFDSPPPPARHIDWQALADSPGVRLVVGWRSLRPPPQRPDLLASTTVEVQTVVEGTPAQVFNRFHPPSVGGIADGWGSPHWKVDGRSHYAGAILGIVWPAPEPGSDLADSLVGDLILVTDLLDSQRFRSLRMRFGFHLSENDPRPSAGHPLPVNSTTLQVTIAKHPKGRQVTIVHEGIPRWLTDDVNAFWQMVLDRNRGNGKYRASMPWSR
jgi:hypothetical protein